VKSEDELRTELADAAAALAERYALSGVDDIFRARRAAFSLADDISRWVHR